MTASPSNSSSCPAQHTNVLRVRSNFPPGRRIVDQQCWPRLGSEECDGSEKCDGSEGCDGDTECDGGKDDVRRESDSSTGGNNALVKEISQCGGVCGEL